MDSRLSSSVLASVPSAVCVVNSEGRILDGNGNLEKYLGRGLDVQRGRLLAGCLSGAITDAARPFFWPVALNGALASGHTTYLSLPTDFRTGCAGRHIATLVGVAAPWCDGTGSRSGARLLFHDGALCRGMEGVRARFPAAIPACLVEAMGDKLWHAQGASAGCRLCFSLPREPISDGEGGA
jgi:hypothetical protein